LAKVIGIVNEMYIYSQTYYPITYVRLEGICRMKISDLNKIQEGIQEPDLFRSTIDLLEDEISIF
jgi:hypothetical protein